MNTISVGESARYEPRLPGDKSISHRVLMMSAMAHGVSRIKNLSESDDVKATRSLLESLGVLIWNEDDEVCIEGRGFDGFSSTLKPLNCMNSGTTARHMLALLAFESFESSLIGDASLSRRPMNRIVDPLVSMGARIALTQERLPAQILPASTGVKDFSYRLPIASGQVKSALLLSAAKNGVNLKLSGQLHGRDHTERLIPLFGGEVDVYSEAIMLPLQPKWKAVSWSIPSDISAASFWIAKTLLEPDSQLIIRNVGLNATRMGFVRALQDMGANIQIDTFKEGVEPVGTIIVKSSRLKGIHIDEVTDFIDEVPLLVLLATQAEGASVIEGAHELKFKESNRILATQSVLQSMGLFTEISNSGFFVQGSQSFQSGVVDPRGDHRLAMLGLVAQSSQKCKIDILNSEVAQVSDPYFCSQMRPSL